MKKTIKLYSLMLLIICITLSACKGNTNNSKTEDPITDSTQTDQEEQTDQTDEPDQSNLQSLPKQDRAGNDIEVPAEINKIISLAPATSQVIDTLELKEKLIAVDTASPSYVTNIDALPQFDMMTPDNESILALEPDIVFVSGMSISGSDDPFQSLRDMGVCVAVIPSSDSIDGIKKDIQFIADCLGTSEQGTSITNQMQADIDEIAAIGSTISSRKSVMFEISALPSIYSFGKGVFLQEMLDIIGADNVFADQSSWLAVTEESAIAANPDVILTSVNYIDNPVDEILARNGWQNITAIKNKEVYYIDNGTSSLPNQHIVTALRQMAKYIYPDAYADIEVPAAK